MKLSKQDIEEIKKLKSKGLKIKEIARKFNVSTNTIYYHTLEKTKRKTKERSRKKQLRMTKEEKMERAKYMREYYKKRYWSDPEFRKKRIKWSKAYQLKRRIKNEKLK